MERETEKLAVKRFPPRIHANDVVAGVTPCYIEINTANAGVAKLADAPDLGFDETGAASSTWPSEFTGQSQNAARTCKLWIQPTRGFSIPSQAPEIIGLPVEKSAGQSRNGP